MLRWQENGLALSLEPDQKSRSPPVVVVGNYSRGSGCFALARAEL